MLKSKLQQLEKFPALGNNHMLATLRTHVGNIVSVLGLHSS